MDQTTRADWEAHMSRSFSHKRDVAQVTLLEGSMTHIPFEMQPFDIHAVPIDDGGDLVALTCYSWPEVRLFRLQPDDGGQHLTLDRWTRICAVHNQGDAPDNWFRLFPDEDLEKRGNRADRICLDPRHTGFYAGRNARRHFFHYQPPVVPGGKWMLTKRFDFPGEELPNTWVISFRLSQDGGTIYTLEGNRSAGQTTLVMRQYPFDGTEIGDALEESDLPVNLDQITGMTIHPTTGEPWFITRGTSTSTQGIYCKDQLIVPNVWGSGLTFLSSGSLLVARYGIDDPSPLGLPGGFIYVPVNILDN